MLAFCRAGVSKTKSKIPKKPRAKASLLAFCRAGVSKAKPKIPKKPRAKASLLAFCRAGVSKAKPKIRKVGRGNKRKQACLRFAGREFVKYQRPGAEAGEVRFCRDEAFGTTIRDERSGTKRNSEKLADESAVQCGVFGAVVGRSGPRPHAAPASEAPVRSAIRVWPAGSRIPRGGSSLSPRRNRPLRTMRRRP